ncbi:hypothetical protein PMIN05_006045 [Paraphaeosphaeria minitans]
MEVEGRAALFGQVRSSQVKSSQVKSSQVKSSQVRSSQVNRTACLIRHSVAVASHRTASHRTAPHRISSTFFLAFGEGLLRALTRSYCVHRLHQPTYLTVQVGPPCTGRRA